MGNALLTELDAPSLYGVLIECRTRVYSSATKLIYEILYFLFNFLLSESNKYDSLQKRLSMEPSARVKLSKLEWVRIIIIPFSKLNLFY